MSEKDLLLSPLKAKKISIVIVGRVISKDRVIKKEAKKIKSDNFKRKNREDSNITIAVLNT